MRKTFTILAAVIAVLGLSWFLLKEKEGRRLRVTAAPPEKSAPLQQAGSAFAYNFDGDTVGSVPAQFHGGRTGQGAASQWVVVADPTAPSPPHVVGQVSTDSTGYRFPLLIADEGSFRDLEMSVRFKAVSGDVDPAAGLVFRSQRPPSDRSNVRQRRRAASHRGQNRGN